MNYLLTGSIVNHEREHFWCQLASPNSSQMAFGQVHSSVPPLLGAVTTEDRDQNIMNLGKLKNLKFLIPYNWYAV